MRFEANGRATPLKRNRLSDQLFRKLTLLITSGEFPGGSVLPSVAALSREYGVSTHIAREAIAALATRGLVEVIHGRGSFVTPRSKWRLVDQELIAVIGSEDLLPNLFEVRQTFEVGLARLAAIRRSDADVAELAAILEQSQADRSPDNQVECDSRFHRVLARATRNPLFLPLLDAIMDPLHRYFRLSQSLPDTVDRTYHGHLTILQAITARDAAAAAKAMRAHLKAGREICERVTPSLQHRPVCDEEEKDSKSFAEDGDPL